MLFFLFVSNQSIACMAGGMERFYPLAMEGESLWNVAITAGRTSWGKPIVYNCYLFRLDAQMQVQDSEFIYSDHEKFEGKDEWTSQDEISHLIDSFYEIGLQHLKAKNLNLKWVTLLGYSSGGEHEESPLRFLRHQEINIYRDTIKNRRLDTIYVYNDTVNQLDVIQCYGRRYQNFEFKTFGNELETISDVRSAPISSSRLYRLPDEKFLLVVHINEMHFHENAEGNWNQCFQTADGMCSEAKDQEVTWHHNGRDYFVFLK